MRKRGPVYVVAITLLTFHVTLLLPTLALAQQQQGQVIQTGQIIQPQPTIKAVGEGSQYYLGEANELLMRVNVWGRVLRPGQYFVPATTDLITLLSAAGGPVPHSRITDVRVVRANPEGESQIVQVNLKKYLATGDKRLIPSLKPEDTVLVSGSSWQLFVDIMQVVGDLALVATVYYNFFVRKN